MKDALSPQELFADLGLKYFGPVDGHDVAAMESALRRARHFGGPVIVHAVTRKGCGYPPAENDVAEQMHSPAAFDPDTGRPDGADAGRLDHGVRRGDGGAGPRAPGRRRDHRGDARADGPRAVRRGLPGPLLRRRHRRAARADLGRRARRGRAAPGRGDLLDVPEPGVRPAAHGRGAAPAGGHAGAGPGRRHRQRRAVAQRDVGPVDPRGRPGHAGGRAARRRDAARGAGRGRRDRRRAHGAALPEGRGDRLGAGGAPDRRGGRPARAGSRRGSARSSGEPQVLLVCAGAFAELGVVAATAAGRAGRGGHGRRPAVGPADPGRAGRPGRGAPARGHRHRQRAPRRVRLGAGRRPAGRRVRRPAARPRAAPGVPRARQPGGRAGRGRA